MNKLPGFLKKGEKNSILFADSGHLTFFIPEAYFTKGFAEMDGEFIKVIGIFNYSLYDEKEKPVLGLKLFNFPSLFTCQPSEITKEKGLKLTKNHKAEDYRLLKFTKGDRVIVSTKVPMLVGNVEEFFRMFTGGALPNGIPYDKKHEYFLENAAINGYNYQVPASLIGVIVGEPSRALNDSSKPFRLTGSTDMTAYQNVNIKEIPNIVSPFTAVTSENWDESMTNAIVNKNHISSPLEKLFMG